MNGKFEPIRADLSELKINMNVVSRNEHVQEVEFCIRRIKERMRGAYSTLTFHSMPHQLIIDIVYWDIFWINIFPADAGISKSIIPR